MNSLYWVIGVLVIMNMGTIIAVAGASFKGIWWLSKLDSRVTRNTFDINNAHAKLRAREEE
jgi:hypothetical protein